MRRPAIILALILLSSALPAQVNKVEVKNSPSGMRLVANGKDFFIKGMNWDYFPIGTNYSYILWQQPEDVIKAALDYEMPLLKNMGVNALRQYTGIPAKWISYIYEKYGIYTVINHSFGRYGLTLNGNWVPNTDYGSPLVKELLFSEVRAMVNEYKNTPGLLMYLLGNENNYGLFWEGAETENVPTEEKKSTIGAKHLYHLFNEAAVEMKSMDLSHPIAICNGDLMFLDIIKTECKAVDVLGINIYRGISFTDAFDRVKKEYGKPVMFTEFGADAFNETTLSEDQASQAKYLLGNWKEIYANAAGMGKAGNCLGGFTFQFSDGWWKTGQTKNLDVHDRNASWSNGGYLDDYKTGKNNMNEEWFGICAKGPTNTNGVYPLYPRAAYYALKAAHQYNPYSPKRISLSKFFKSISIPDAVLKARGNPPVPKAVSYGKPGLPDLKTNLAARHAEDRQMAMPESEASHKSAHINSFWQKEQAF